jgi:hypothetical protein
MPRGCGRQQPGWLESSERFVQRRCSVDLTHDVEIAVLHRFWTRKQQLFGGRSDFNRTLLAR